MLILGEKRDGEATCGEVDPDDPLPEPPPITLCTVLGVLSLAVILLKFVGAAIESVADL